MKIRSNTAMYRPAQRLNCWVGLVAFTQVWALLVNGKPSATAPIKQEGEIYVPLSALKAAGAQVTDADGKISIRFLPYQGGANQADAVEGASNEWLFNGIWRVRVLKVESTVDPFDADRPGVNVTFEVRNGTSKAVSMFQTGVQKPQLVDEEDEPLAVDEGAWQTKVQMKQLLPGEGVTAAIPFYYRHGMAASETKPAKKIVLLIDPTFGLLRDTGLKYSAKSPSFRIWLDKQG